MPLGFTRFLRTIRRYLNATAHKSRSGRERLAPLPRFHPHVEIFEDRTLLSTLSIVGGSLTFNLPTAGANNQLTVAVSGGVYTFSDPGDPITLGAGTANWTQNTPNSVSGPASDVTLTIAIELGDGTNSATFSSLANTASYTGTGGTNTAIGPNATTTWNLTGANASTLNVSGFTVTNTAVQNLQGGTGNDDFVFGAAGSVSGTLNGGTGVNELDYSSAPAGVTVNLGTGTATSTGGVSNISVLKGSIFNDSLTGNPGGSTTFLASRGTDTVAAAGLGNTLVGVNLAETWNITGGAAGALTWVTPAPTNTTSFSGIQNLQGGTANDTFTFGANGSVTGNIDGGTAGTDTLDNTAIAGATVNVTGTGTNHGVKGTATGVSGTFDDITNLATTSLTVNGPNQTNTMVVNASGANAGNYQLNGGTVVPFTGITRFTYNGNAGNDTLTINDPNGTLFAPTGGIFFNGGLGTDTLIVQGGTATSGRYTPSSNAPDANGFSGVLTHINGALTQTIIFTGLDPMTDLTIAPTFEVDGTSNGESINIVDGPVVGGTQTTEVNSGASGTFEKIDFANKTTVTVFGGPGAGQVSGVDTFTVNNPTPAAGLTTLIVRPGTTAGSTVNILTTPSTVTTSVVSQAAVTTINIGNSGSVQGILGTVNLENPPAENTVAIDDSADATARTVTISDLGVNFPGDDTATDAWGRISGLAPANINYEYSDNVNGFTINGGTGGNTFNVQATGDTASGEFAPLTINSGNSTTNNDTINVGSAANSLASIIGSLTINGQANSTTTTTTACAGTPVATSVVVGDTVNLLDQGDAANVTYAIGATTITATGTAAINYSNIETLSLQTSTGNDSITVSGPPTGLTHLILTGNSQAATVDTFTINATAATTATELKGGAGNDVFNVTSSPGLGLCIDGGPPTTTPGDTFNFNANGQPVTFGAGTVQGDSNEVVAYTNIETFNYTNPGTAIVINGTAGNDTVVVNVTGTNSGNFQLNSGFVIPFSGITSLIFNGNGGSDKFQINYTNNTSTFAVTDNSTGDTNASMSVKGTGATTAVYKGNAATNGNGTVLVNGIQTITFQGLKPVDLSGMATATIEFPNADDVVNIDNGVDIATGTVPALVISGTSGGVGFESVHAFNNTNLVIDTVTGGTDGNDTVTINTASNAHANTNLSITTGSGTDNINVNGNLTVTGTVSLQSGQNITLNGGNISAGTMVTLTANTGAINEAGAGIITGTTLTTSSATGTNLANNNTVATFNATNSTSGAINLTNTAALGITGIAQNGTAAGSNVSVTTTGNLTTTGAITTTAAANGTISLTATTGALTIGAAVTAGGSGTVALTNTGAGNNLAINAAVSSTSGAITATSSGTIGGTGTFSTTGLLTTSSVGGTTLTNANKVGSFAATNATSGAITLTNTAATLTVTGITQSGTAAGSNVSVTNTGNLTTTGAITTTAAANGTISLTATTGALSVGAAVTAGGSGTVALTNTGAGNNMTINGAVSSTSGALTATSSGTIGGTGTFSTTGLLTTSSVGGTTLTNANKVGSFAATNATSGAITLTNTAATLTVTGITQSGTAAGSNVSVTNTGNLTTTGAITTTAAANGTISLSATTGALTIGAAVTAGGSGTVTLTNTGAGNNMAINAAVSSTSGNISATSSGTISGTGTFSTTGLLTTSSVGGTALGNANTVGSFNATNTTSGDIVLNNAAAPLTITGISQTGGGNVAVVNTGTVNTTGAITTAANGNVTLIATNGAMTIGAPITAGGSGSVTLTNTGAGNNLTVNAAVSTVAGVVGTSAIGLTSSGTISGTGTFSTAGTLVTSSVGGTTLTNANTVGSFNATNTTSGNIAFTNTAATLIVTGVSQSGGGNVNIANTGNLTTTGAVTATGSGGITLAANGGTSDLSIGANVTSPIGPIVLTAARNVNLTAGTVSTQGTTTVTATAGAITESGTGTIGGGAALTTSSATGTALGNANTVASFNATNSTSGAITLTNTAPTLTITGISQAVSNPVTVSNTGKISITGTISDLGATTTLTATGTIAETGAGLITSSGLTTSSVGGTTLTGANVIGGSFIATNTTSGDIVYNDSAAMALLGPITESGGGNVTATVTGNIIATAPISATGAGNITLTATTSLLTSSTITSGTGVITLNAGPILNLQAGTLITTSGTGTIALNGGQGTVVTLNQGMLNAPAGATITGLGNNDTFNITLPTTAPAVATPVRVTGGGPTTGVTVTTAFPSQPTALPAVGSVLNLTDSAVAGSNTYALTGTTFQRTVSTVSATGLITYGTLSTVNFSASSGLNTINVAGTLTGGNTTVNASSATKNSIEVFTTGIAGNTRIQGSNGGDTMVVDNTGSSSFTELDGGSAKNFFVVRGTSGLAQVFGGNGGNAFFAGNVAGSINQILGGVNFVGGTSDTPVTPFTTLPNTPVRPAPSGTSDSLTISDQGTTTSGNLYAIATTVVQRGGAPLFFSHLTDLTLNAATGMNNTLDVLATGNAMNTTINGDGTNNSFIIQGTGMSGNNIFNAGPGSDAFRLLATGTSSFNQINGQAGAAAYVASTGSNSLAEINSGSTAFFASIGADQGASFGTMTNLLGLVSVNGKTSLGVDVLDLHDEANTTNSTYSLENLAFRHNASHPASGSPTLAPVAFNAIANLIANMGAGTDLMSIKGTLKSQATQINGGGGADFFDTISTTGTTSILGGAAPSVFMFHDGTTLSGGSIRGRSGADQFNLGQYNAPTQIDLVQGIAMNTATKTPIAGLSGVNAAIGGQAGNQILGGTGNFVLLGGISSDTITGGAGGSNVVYANDHPGTIDVLNGGLGFTYFVINSQDDLINGSLFINLGVGGGQVILASQAPGVITPQVSYNG